LFSVSQYVQPISAQLQMWVGSEWVAVYQKYIWIYSLEALDVTWPVWGTGPYSTLAGTCLCMIVGRGNPFEGKYLDYKCDIPRLYVCEYELP
jgi:hypothetical protein